nr:hypothetical protein Q903MT_gene2557 [Picea sitchensis]
MNTQRRIHLIQDYTLGWNKHFVCLYTCYKMEQPVMGMMLSGGYYASYCAYGDT